MYNLSVCLSDIPQEHMQRSKKNGKIYVNLTVGDKREVDNYGNDAYVAINKTKEQREADPNKIYVGSGKKVEFNGGGDPVTGQHPFAATTPTETTEQGAGAFNPSPGTKDDLPF